jgi:hypothetical protein
MDLPVNVAVFWRFLLGVCVCGGGGGNSNYAENIGRHRTRFILTGDQTHGICTPMYQAIDFGLIFQLREFVNAFLQVTTKKSGNGDHGRHSKRSRCLMDERLQIR